MTALPRHADIKSACVVGHGDIGHLYQSVSASPDGLNATAAPRQPTAHPSPRGRTVAHSLNEILIAYSDNAVSLSVFTLITALEDFIQ